MFKPIHVRAAEAEDVELEEDAVEDVEAGAAEEKPKVKPKRKPAKA